MKIADNVSFFKSSMSSLLFDTAEKIKFTIGWRSEKTLSTISLTALAKVEYCGGSKSICLHSTRSRNRKKILAVVDFMWPFSVNNFN